MAGATKNLGGVVSIQSLINGLWLRFRLAIREDFRQRVLQDSALVFLGNMLSLGLGVISSAVLARGLGPAGLSAFAIVGATTSIAASISDFGLRLTAIRHISGTLGNSVERAQAMARSYASLKLLGSTGVALLLLLLAEPLSTLVQLPPENGATLLRIGALVMWATLLNALPGTVLHALTLFRRLITVQLINVALTVLLMTALWLAARLNVATALLVGGVTAAVAALVSVAFLPEEWRRSIGLTLNARRELFGENSRRLLGFSRWMWVSQIFTILSVQIDVLLLGFFLPLPAVGIYALARNLAQKAGAVNQTLHTVLAPGASSLSTANQRRDYVRRSLVRSGLLAALILLAMPLARPFILFVYGQEYAASVNLFLALLLLVLFDLLVSPLFLLALPLDRPGLLALADGAQVAALLLVGIIAVPLFGAYGIVVARIAGRVVAGLVALPPLLLSVRLPNLRDERP